MKRGSDGDIVVEDSAIDQALRRPEDQRYVEAEWSVTKDNRRGRYHRVTRVGRHPLDEQAATWMRDVRRVGDLLSDACPGGS